MLLYLLSCHFSYISFSVSKKPYMIGHNFPSCQAWKTLKSGWPLLLVLVITWVSETENRHADIVVTIIKSGFACTKNSSFSLMKIIVFVYPISCRFIRIHECIAPVAKLVLIITGGDNQTILSKIRVFFQHLISLFTRHMTARLWQVFNLFVLWGKTTLIQNLKNKQKVYRC